MAFINICTNDGQLIETIHINPPGTESPNDYNLEKHMARELLLSEIVYEIKRAWKQETEDQ